MPYVAMSDLVGMIPAPFLAEALDDLGTGVANEAVWEQVAADAAAEVDGILGARFPVPFTAPYPAVVVSSAKTFACCAVFIRRGKVDKDNNPFLARRDQAIKQLTAIAAGDQRLLPIAAPSISVISQPAKTVSKFGNISA